MSDSATALNDRAPELIQRSREIRQEPGCLQYEYFRAREFDEELVRLELWATQADFDRHWKQMMDKGIPFSDTDPKLIDAPFRRGTPQAPRRHGENGVEFYRHAYVASSEGSFLPTEEAERIDSLRWPIRSALRLILQSHASPDAPFQPQAYYDETRAEFGCTQFEHYRSIEFPENRMTLELWDSPKIYDVHFLHRAIQRIYGVGTGPGSAGPRQPIERRYGRAGYEFYEHSYFSLVDGVWQPSNEEQRMVTLRLP
jgi:quinol monooxygenase YgiN